jgi:hypothetical protein
MENCNMKRGFFFLRDCDHPAHQSCSVCGKAFCNDHLRIKPDSNEPICLDCLGKSMQQQPQEKTKGSGRNRYNDDSSYRPWYIGHRSDLDGSHFGENDIRVFESSAEIDDMDAEAPDPEANVFDS